MNAATTAPTYRDHTIVLAASLLICGMWGNSSLQADGTDKVELRYRFHQDQVVRYDVSLRDDYKIQVGGETDTPYSYQDSVKNYRVKAVEEDGSAILELTIESVKLEIFQNGEQFKFDSEEVAKSAAEREKLNDQPVFQAMHGLVGRPHLQLKMSPRGEVSAFVPLVAGDQVPDNPGQVAFDVLLRLPEEPLAVGESWREDFELALPIPDSMLKKSVKLQRRYTLKSLEGSLATIDLQTKVLSILSTPEEEMHLLRRRPNGTVVIDLDRGIILKKELQQANEVTGFEMGASLMSFRQKIVETLRPDQSASDAAPAVK